MGVFLSIFQEPFNSPQWFLSRDFPYYLKGLSKSLSMFFVRETSKNNLRAFFKSFSMACSRASQEHLKSMFNSLQTAAFEEHSKSLLEILSMFFKLVENDQRALIRTFQGFFQKQTRASPANPRLTGKPWLSPANPGSHRQTPFSPAQLCEDINQTLAYNSL